VPPGQPPAEGHRRPVGYDDPDHLRHVDVAQDAPPGGPGQQQRPDVPVEGQEQPSLSGHQIHLCAPV
jgi:hypothetical protein